ncbi:hypothetical protein [Pseudomonas sp. 10S4]|uniref:hypothetical protein n=1 Tax=Pseudomonas sp. 10S4 TaxID=3048583 RepID=UPI002AC93814|nr:MULTISPECIES: hypothetical protein [unclassified Pseudomonas]MEB0226301.1 hypothetical protein [Pseudomonas sp. 5S1]MEB0298256.1 hypothetical protein [Pseudomonas sp. 10S4]WPX18175.1 hypothetical protein RHM58_31260 [Pseudomonas sp. 10S4]
MSTFAVFGMSENWAREEAREQTSTHKTENGKRLERTIPEWEAAVEAYVAKIMAGKKCVRLSPMFDAPSTPSSSWIWRAAVSPAATCASGRKQFWSMPRASRS